MIKVKLMTPEFFDEIENVFIPSETIVLEMEHCLRAMRDWESEWKIPFLSETQKTDDQVYSYISNMCLEEVPRNILTYISNSEMERIKNYISDSHTATTFPKGSTGGRSNEIVTAEVIYHMLTACSIPFEAETWNLNSLLTLIRTCSVKNAPPKKMNKTDVMKRDAALNKKRLQQHGLI